ncbi:hypothetical protein [Desulfonatronum thioautotrophicum]|uniref:hypothetical protein n=1 Tax=Desulfonatronum thioautotrophicum TaxID=617001 RepID=UPI0005EB657D|nr:hypothetical protein [Desulfonatronum thioautotrophicum]
MSTFHDKREEARPPRLVRDQHLITSCALDIIATVEQTRGIPLQPRDRMALKLLTPRNSALLLQKMRQHLGCRQISFDILTDDLGLGTHQLVPSGVHVLNKAGLWWSDGYGVGRFLWNLYVDESPQTGMSRVLERLFKFEVSGVFGPRANMTVLEKTRTIEGEVRPDLRLYIHRREGTVETSLRKLLKAQAIFRPKDLGLCLEGSNIDRDNGRIVLLFGKTKRYAVSFTIHKI